MAFFPMIYFTGYEAVLGRVCFVGVLSDLYRLV